MQKSSAWRVTGRIVLEMPYTVVSTPGAGARMVQFEVKEEPVHVPGQGPLVRRQVVALVPRHSEWQHGLEMAGRLEEDLKALREMTTFAGVKNFSGYIHLIGDNPLDSKRFSFKRDNHRLVIEEAELRWPDSTPVEIP
jgi:hypothetical protein